MNTFELIDIAFTALERRKNPPDPQQPRNRSSYAPVEGSTPTANVGTADVGDPNYDGPACSCGARGACRCGPIVDNE